MEDLPHGGIAPLGCLCTPVGTAFVASLSPLPFVHALCLIAFVSLPFSFPVSISKLSTKVFVSVFFLSLFARARVDQKKKEKRTEKKDGRYIDYSPSETTTTHTHTPLPHLPLPLRIETDETDDR